MKAARFSSVGRIAGVLILGTFGLHQLSYFLHHGDGAAQALAGDGHGYLVALGPALLVVALALLIASVVVRLCSDGDGPGGAGREANAAILALSFLALFVTQELLEGMFAAGHPHGLDAVAQSWIALPLALPIGALAALGLTGLRRTDRLLAAAVRPLRLRAACALPAGMARAEARLALIMLALPFGLTRRGPPAAATA
jgi:hypothetical protein